MKQPNVAMAAGMVSVQGHCTVDEALVLMTEHARKTSQTVEIVAEAVVERVLRFDHKLAS